MAKQAISFIKNELSAIIRKKINGLPFKNYSYLNNGKEATKA